MKRTLMKTLPLIAALTLAAFAQVPGEIKVGSQIAGKIKYVRVKEGAKVRPGQILAILEFDDAMKQCASADAELQQKQADLRKAVTSEGPEDRARAEEEVALARAKVDATRAEWEKQFIRAPISGVVGHEYQHAGDAVSNAPLLAIMASR